MNMRAYCPLALATSLGIAACFGFVTDAFGADTIAYNRDVRPLLSDRCFACHGPDQASRKAGLRLDQAEAAYAEARKPHTFAIVPGKPEQSLLISRIFSQDPEELMPPAKSHLSLTAEEKSILRRWIAEGAVYQPHWAWVPPADQVPVPEVQHKDWARNEIDRFILSRLEQQKINPSPEADKLRWLRRVTFDLTGLPPSSEELDAFLADHTESAHERVVNRLLASPRFGERLAVPWLDAARYADSYGYQSDQMSPTWPFRDWVVNAFNRNQRFDEFLTEQLAGDLLPHATRRQKLATAFSRLHRQTNEGGSIADEWRNEYVSDRVHTFGTTFLALTFECSRCHDHKFDPITQKDYYSLSAFFNSIDEYGLYLWGAPNHVPTPTLLLPTPEEESKLAATTQALDTASNQVSQMMLAAEADFKAWLAKPEPGTNSGLVAHYSLDELNKDNQFTDELNAKGLSSGLRHNTAAEGKIGKAVQFTGDDEITFPNPAGSLHAWEQYSLTFWLQVPHRLTNAIILHRTDGTDTGFWGTELSLEDGKLFFVIKRFWPGNALAIESTAQLPFDQWVQVGVTYDGSGQAGGIGLFLNGQTTPSEVVRNHLYKSPQNGGGGITFGGRMRTTGLKEARLDDLRIYDRTLSALELAEAFQPGTLATALATAGEDQRREYFQLALSPKIREAMKARSAALKSWLDTATPVQETSVMEELPAPRPAYLLARGRYDAPKTDQTRVPRTVPAVLPTLPSDYPNNRLGLAKWLTDPRHPLTSRVAVNRFWQMIFGRGLVATTENFGVQGSPPTHPELLDWLARDFINSGWDVKALLKKMVLSATYRQDSRPRSDLTNDPDNLLLARGPAQRLPAEMIRDTALAASGLLVTEMGGPPVSPYQPGDLWRESNSMSPAYQQGKGPALYRRSLYTVWKRTAPMPNMMAFDATSREVCVVRRNPTATPQQAFVLLNDTQFVEACRVLAEKTLHEGGEDAAQRVRYMFRRLAGREPDPRERSLLADLIAEQSTLFALEPERAEKLIAVGDRKRDPALNPIQLAALTEMAQAILNLDATVWKR